MSEGEKDVPVWCSEHMEPYCPRHSAENDAGRFYLGVGIDQRRCAACAAYPTMPCAVHRDHHPGCTGASDCPGGLHEHGCYADLDGSACNDPSDHFCDNYVWPLTCLTAPSTETGRCDRCRACVLPPATPTEPTP